MQLSTSPPLLRQARPSKQLCPNTSQYTHLWLKRVSRPVRRRAGASACAADALHDSSHLPSGLVQQLKTSNRSWVEDSVSRSLDYNGSCTVYIVGVCFWAPLQQQLVTEALQQLQPDAILFEQPREMSKLMLPHPQWMQTVMDWQQWQQGTKQLDTLVDELTSCQVSHARVGKDIVDPYETFGYYAGLDLFKQPQHVAQGLQLCGFMPGQELVVAAEHALMQGTPLHCIDAPLRLQESWVRGLITHFTSSLSEQTVNSYQPLKDLQSSKQLASTFPAAAEWDRQLSDLAAHIQQGAAEASKQPDAQAADVGAKQAAEQALLLFKVSKATAAALLPPDDAMQAQVLGLMQRLQPLKWRHFALRQEFMAQQIKEAAAACAKQALRGRTTGKKPVLLAIIGRQHCGAVTQLWRNPASHLWRTEVPHTFAPSVVEAAADAATSPRGPAAVHGKEDAARAD